MTDEFLTKGLQNDRYLKARQLIKKFEEEITVALKEIGDEMVAQNPDLFNDAVNVDKSTSTMSRTFPHARFDYPMNRIRSPKNDNRLKLNVHLYWYEPRNYNRTDIDGALRALGYKIKNISKTDEQRVVSETRDWPIQTAEARFGEKIDFYNHVSSAEEFKQTGAQLVEHFSTFGDEYGVTPKP